MIKLGANFYLLIEKYNHGHLFLQYVHQALCVRLRQLEQLSKSIFVGEDRLTEKLLKEIVETVIIWLSNNQYLWIETVQLSCIGRCSCLEQVRIHSFPFPVSV